MSGQGLDWQTSLVWLTVLIPLALAALYCSPPLRPWMCRLTPWAPLPAMVLVFAAPEAQWIEPWLLLGGGWGLTDLTRPFLGVTALVWLCAGIHATGYLTFEPRHHRFYLFWLLTLAGNLGLILAQDIASFYSCFGLMTFAAYGLIVHSSTAEANRAGRVYLIMAVIGEGLLLAGFILACGESVAPMLPNLPAAIAASEQRNLIMALLWMGFGIKAGVPLLHMWLPLAHPVAPTPASAVLSGAMIKAGLLGWLLTLPLGGETLLGWGQLIMAVGLLGAYGGALIGLVQTQPKTVLAYSSISQMGLMTMLVGAAFLVPRQWLLLAVATVLYAVHHGLAKGALFLGVGAAQHYGRHAPKLVWLGLLIPALALSGLPFSSGALAKTAMKAGLHAEAANLPVWWGWLPTLLSLGAVGTALLMARFLWLLRPEFGRKTAPAGLSWGWGLAVVASLTGIFWLPLMPETPLKFDSAPDKLLGLLWPLLLALLLTWLALSRNLPWPKLPPGDVLVVLASLGNRGLHRISRAASVLSSAEKRGAKRLSKLREILFKTAARANQLELWWIRDGAMVGVGLVLLMMVLFYA